ncbi:MAG: tRNA pseudouridine(13) synthase TruD [Thermoplasmata archaeon]|nr:MAG: tRNA pseudouridine(13) synthase TruD [Thermoplasmata archaeon]
MEEDIGIEVFITKSKGIGGKIKKEPEDFIVEEVPIYPQPSNGRYVIARVTSRNWETNRLIEKLAHNLKISSNSIGYAGIKDKRAVTTQLMSFPVDIEKLKNISIPDVEIEILYKSSKPVYSGKLIGNRFHIVIRDVEGSKEDVERIMKEIENLKLIPNFFGVQRFGIARPITHIVGKYILKNDMEKAVMTYIANPIKGEDEESYKARKFLEETRDFEEALKIYPRKLVFERRIIEYLCSHPGEWKNALLRLPKNLVRIFLHAYQSYLFNKILSCRIKKNLPIDEALEGDIIIIWDKEMVVQSYEGIKVNKNNIDKINRQIKKHRCFPSAAIVGYDLLKAEGIMGDIEKKVMEKEGITEDEFKIPHMPELACRGMRRIISVPVKHLKWQFDGKNLHLQFFLPKGCYATSLLREIMKADIFSY